MRKALIGILMGATMVTPVAASAAPSQTVDGEQRRARTPAANWPGQEDRVRRVMREARTETRQERREDRRERRDDRRERREERRNDRPDNRGDRLERREDRLERREERLDRRQDRVERRLDRRPTPRLERRADRLERREDRVERRLDRVERRQDRREWNRNWRADRRYDWQRWRYQNRNVFRLGRYYAPYSYGYGYNRFSIGLRLGSPFYSSRYWIDDPWRYRLPPAYAGTRWVRYYDDVLLVDLYTGEVVDVIYDFFW